MNLIRTIRSQLSMPLLGKELVEQAARKRTYVIRVLYAVLLFGCGAMMLYDQYYRYGSDIFHMLGRGENLFMMLIAVQFAGIALFMPPLMCSAITSEKENNSLVLLMVTDLRPWQIIMQKYLGRLVPMLTFLLLSLPLMALTYALGGVTTDRIASGILTLLIGCLQVGAMCLMLSAWSRSTGTAFILCYLFGAVFYLGPGIIAGLMEMWHIVRLGGPPYLALAHIPVFAFFGKGGSFSSALTWSWPAIISIVVFLLLARVFLVRRAFLTPKNLVLNVFRWLDVLFKKMNSVTGNVMLIKERDSLPGDDAVAWWEVSRRAMGKPHYLFRIGVVIAVPSFLLIALLLVGAPRGQGGEALSALLFFIWPIGALLLSVQGASTFTLDRARQTLDVLLTVPISGHDLVIQKTAALRRLIIVFFIPVIGIAGFEAWWEFGRARTPYGGYGEWGHTFLYLLCTALCAAIYLPMVAWMSLWLSMKIRNQTRAIITAVMTLVLWCAVPWIVFAMLAEFWRGPDERFLWIALFSPATLLALNEFTDIDDLRIGILPALVANFAFFAAMCVWFRHLCVTRADRYLGRA